MNAVLGTLAAALAVAAAVPGAVAADPAPGVMAYSRGGTVYVAAGDGTGERPYVAGEWPSMHTHWDRTEIAWVARRGTGRVLMRARLDSRERPVEVVALPPGNGRVRAHWTSGPELAVVVEDGDRYEVAVVRGTGGAWAPLDLGRVVSPGVVWHDSRLAVATEDGPVLYDPRDGSVDAVPGAREGDLPADTNDSTRLFVNAPGGAAVVDRTAATREPYLDGGYVWDLMYHGALYTRGREVGCYSHDRGARPYATLPEGVRVVDAVNAHDPLLELADADGNVAIYAAPRPPDHRLVAGPDPVPTFGVVEPVPPVRKVADGAGVTVNRSLEIGAVVPAGPPAPVVATTRPPVPRGVPSTPDPGAAPGWLSTAALVAAAAVGAGGLLVTRRA